MHSAPSENVKNNVSEVVKGLLRAPLNEEQFSIGVIAVKQASCEPVLGSSFCPEQRCSALVLARCIPVYRANLHRCKHSDKVQAVSLFCRAALNTGELILP